MTALEALESRTGSKWEHLRMARQTSASERAAITGVLDTSSTADSSIVVVGSLAPEECTPGERRRLDSVAGRNVQSSG